MKQLKTITSGLSLNANTLKYIAIIAMTVDHVAFLIFPQYYSTGGIIMHTIGRITAPIIFYFAAEGYHYTKNLKRYLGRLFIFACISQFPFMYFETLGNMEKVNYLSLNIIFTIFLAILAIKIRRELTNPVLKVFLIIFIIMLSTFCNWGSEAIIITLIFDYYRGNFKNQAFAYCLFTIINNSLLAFFIDPIQLFTRTGTFILNIPWLTMNTVTMGLFLPIILLSFYNGQKGSKSSFNKWIFYIFYPLHLLIIGFIGSLIQ